MFVPEIMRLISTDPSSWKNKLTSPINLPLSFNLISFISSKRAGQYRSNDRTGGRVAYLFVDCQVPNPFDKRILLPRNKAQFQLIPEFQGISANRYTRRHDLMCMELNLFYNSQSRYNQITSKIGTIYLSLFYNRLEVIHQGVLFICQGVAQEYFSHEGKEWTKGKHGPLLIAPLFLV